MKKILEKNSGFALIATMIMLSVLLSLLGAFALITKIELATTKLDKNSNIGFNTAEAGLNLRAEEVRQVFVNYNRPTGTSPYNTANAIPCQGNNNGSGDFVCKNFVLGNHTATTYMSEDPANPIITTIPVGERYQNLNAQEYRYTANSLAKGTDGKTEGALELRFKSRLVPLFQFAAFYNKDLEILPGPAMTLSGPVHTNKDLYLNANTSLAISGQVTSVGNLYRGRKDDNTCMSTPVSVTNPVSAVNLKPTCPQRVLINNSDITSYNGMIQIKVPPVEVPQPAQFDPIPGNLYWEKADLRLVLRMNAADTNKSTTASTSGIEVRKNDDTVDSALTTKLNSCAGTVGTKAVGYNSAFYNHRESKYMALLEVDMLALLNCIQSQSLFGAGKTLADTTEGGLVLFFTVDGTKEALLPNKYGFRIRNGSKLQSNLAGAPAVVGLTVVSDQAAYIKGDYNSVNKIPAAIMSDSLNLLSNNWNIADTTSSGALSGRTASNTIVNSAFLSGTDTTGGQDGTSGQGGAYNGGLENYPRFHENWSGKTLTYRGSFVSLNIPRHVNGTWASQSYNPPNRDWNYDTSFNNAANLPPITPRFVYLRQQLFLRDYEL